MTSERKQPYTPTVNQNWLKWALIRRGTRAHWFYLLDHLRRGDRLAASTFHTLSQATHNGMW